MFKGIFDKHAAAPGSKRQKRGSSVSAASTDVTQTSVSSAQPDIMVDEALVRLSRELSALSDIEVPRAAKERGWAALERELQRRPARVGAAAVAGAGAKGGGRTQVKSLHSRSLRWMAASAVGIVAIAGAVLGGYSGGLFTADEGGPTTVASVSTSDTSAAPSTASTAGGISTATSQAATTNSSETAPSTDVTAPSTTEGSAAPNTTAASDPGITPVTPSTSGGSGGSGGSSGSSDTTGTTQRPTSTTQPRTTTTGETQNAAAQREGSAKTAAAYLASVVLTGDISGARGLVAPDAEISLVQMMMSLNEPYGYTLSDITGLTGNTVRVTLAIDDRVVGNDGEIVETVKKFFIRIRVDEDGAIVTAINAGA